MTKPRIRRLFDVQVFTDEREALAFGFDLPEGWADWPKAQRQAYELQAFKAAAKAAKGKPFTVLAHSVGQLSVMELDRVADLVQELKRLLMVPGLASPELLGQLQGESLGECLPEVVAKLQQLEGAAA